MKSNLENALPLRKTHPILKIINGAIYDLPAPPSLNIWWNFGSLLGLCLTIQFVTGLILAMHYTPHTDLAFSSVAHITLNVNKGWLIRSIHANGASLFFICLYCHIGRGIYYHSFVLQEVWLIGALLYVFTMATAFFGYVLPWGQMSFWGATVITNLFSAIPYIGTEIVQWIWGGYAVDNATLTRFFVFHFLFPFLLILLSVLHLLFLHQTGSSSPLGITSDYYLVPFHPYYTSKDLVGFIFPFAFLMYLALLNPYLLGDPENFIPANPLATPLHIQPEWYFLFVYAILRAIPNKGLGVLSLVAALLMLFILPFISTPMIKGNHFNPIGQILFWSLITTFFMLTWLGAQPIEPPYDILGLYFTVAYFICFALIMPVNYLHTNLLLMTK